MKEGTASELDRAVAVATEAEPGVLAAYLFGSRARGEGRADSDLDVAVLEVPGMRLGIDAEERLRLRIRAATQLAVCPVSQCS